MVLGHCGNSAFGQLRRYLRFHRKTAPATEAATTAAPAEVSTGSSDTATVAAEAPVIETKAPETMPVDTATVGEKNALKKAKSYLSFTGFSYTGLIWQLEYEGFTTEEATYAADNCGADWYEQAEKKAKSYLEISAFSQKGLIEQLEYEGFTTSEAAQAVANCGADWYEQAVKKAASYLELSAFSRSGLIDQLVYEGFTNEQAAHGATENGL